LHQRTIKIEIITGEMKYSLWCQIIYDYRDEIPHSHIQFKLNSVLRTNNSSVEILSKDYFVLKFVKGYSGREGRCEFWDKCVVRAANCSVKLATNKAVSILLTV
jgi:hypothetical protein